MLQEVFPRGVNILELHHITLLRRILLSSTVKVLLQLDLFFIQDQNRLEMLSEAFIAQPLQATDVVLAAVFAPLLSCPKKE